ncbi:hypothetical protein ACQFX9_27350 [Aliinostoc sp. HNIBRCY26]|uniref:hypothetical protein n=1 Tax=Aliinostoc sp. HNIBRCY26 TaxID=3418997 RepID=UPI003D03EA9F
MFDHIPVKVLGCLKPGEITVIALTGVGMVDGGILWEIPTEMIPVSLRMPNSEFIVVYDRQNGNFIEILPKS